VAEVEHVEVGVALQARADPVHPGLERLALLRAVERPQVAVRPPPVLGEDGAEEVLQARVAPVLVALEVEEDVARRRLGQPPQAAVVPGLEQLVQRPVTPAGADLQVGLRAQGGERGLRHPRDRGVVGERGELRGGVDAGGLELQALRAVQPGHEGDVVVGPAALVAVLPPVAHVARRDGVGIGDGRLRRGARELRVAGDERLADAAGVRGEVVRAQLGPLAVAEHEVHAGGPDALQALELVGVVEQLEDVARAGAVAELGVVDLVGPRSQRGRLLDPHEEVREPDPALAQEAALVDDLAALAHRGERPRGELGAVGVRVVEGDDVEPLRPQAFEDLVLVAPAALEQEVQGGGQRFGVELAAPVEQVQVGPVLAREESREGARRELGEGGVGRHARQESAGGAES
jgi:hypothetical protein